MLVIREAYFAHLVSFPCFLCFLECGVYVAHVVSFLCCVICFVFGGLCCSSCKFSVLCFFVFFHVAHLVSFLCFVDFFWGWGVYVVYLASFLCSVVFLVWGTSMLLMLLAFCVV